MDVFAGDPAPLDEERLTPNRDPALATVGGSVDQNTVAGPRIPAASVDDDFGPFGQKAAGEDRCGDAGEQ